MRKLFRGQLLVLAVFLLLPAIGTTSLQAQEDQEISSPPKESGPAQALPEEAAPAETEQPETDQAGRFSIGAGAGFKLMLPLASLLGDYSNPATGASNLSFDVPTGLLKAQSVIGAGVAYLQEPFLLTAGLGVLITPEENYIPDYGALLYFDIDAFYRLSISSDPALFVDLGGGIFIHAGYAPVYRQTIGLGGSKTEEDSGKSVANFAIGLRVVPAFAWKILPELEITLAPVLYLAANTESVKTKAGQEAGSFFTMTFGLSPELAIRYWF